MTRRTNQLPHLNNRGCQIKSKLKGLILPIRIYNSQGNNNNSSNKKQLWKKTTSIRKELFINVECVICTQFTNTMIRSALMTRVQVIETNSDNRSKHNHNGPKKITTLMLAVKSVIIECLLMNIKRIRAIA